MKNATKMGQMDVETLRLIASCVGTQEAREATAELANRGEALVAPVAPVEHDHYEVLVGSDVVACFPISESKAARAFALAKVKTVFASVRIKRTTKPEMELCWMGRVSDTRGVTLKPTLYGR